MIKIYLASDHAGVELKARIVSMLQDPKILPETKRDVLDLGPQSLESVDYPDYADLVCKKIHGLSLVNTEAEQISSFPAEVGILICGSGQGMAMRANKFQQVRAALCWTPEVARLSREHNDANILCLASRLTDNTLCLEIVQTFLKTAFAGGRHHARVAKISKPI